MKKWYGFSDNPHLSTKSYSYRFGSIECIFQSLPLQYHKFYLKIWFCPVWCLTIFANFRKKFFCFFVMLIYKKNMWTILFFTCFSTLLDGIFSLQSLYFITFYKFCLVISSLIFYLLYHKRYFIFTFLVYTKFLTLSH